METKLTIKVDNQWVDIKTLAQSEQDRIKSNFQKVWGEATNRHIKERVARKNKSA